MGPTHGSDNDSLATVSDAEAAEAGLGVHDGIDALAQAEAQALDLSEFEDMRNTERRYKRRSGTSDACTLPGERGMPKTNAEAWEWQRYHSSRVGEGGFDPCSLIR